MGAVDSGAEIASFAWFPTATTFRELTSSLCLSSQWNSFSLFTTDLCSPTTSSCQASLLPFLIAASVPSWSSSNLIPLVEELENWGLLAWEWENSSALRSRSRAGWRVPTRRKRCWTLARSQCPNASSSVALSCSPGESLACQLSWRKRVVSSKWKGQVSSEDPLFSSSWLVSKYMYANKDCIPRTLNVSFSHLSKKHWERDIRPAYLVLSTSHPSPDSSTSFLSLANDWIENVEGGEQGNITGSKDELLRQTFPIFPEPLFSTVIPLQLFPESFEGQNWPHHSHNHQSSPSISHHITLWALMNLFLSHL